MVLKRSPRLERAGFPKEIMTDQTVVQPDSTAVAVPPPAGPKESAVAKPETRRTKKREASPVIDILSVAPPQDVVATESMLAREESVATITDATEKPKLEVAPRQCGCGCNDPLITSIPTRRFHQGHDARAKSFVRNVLAGKRSPQEIPQILLDIMDEVPSLRSDRELRKVLLSERSRRAGTAA